MKRKMVDVKITEGFLVLYETVTCNADVPDEKVFKAARNQAMNHCSSFLPMQYTDFKIVNETYFYQ